ncbi:MAG TPA: outer membrane beta-barrel protein [Stellaceae bacterium]|nr:outer membrane beta-barrel protein [Stellaceae bacterium]
MRALTAMLVAASAITLVSATAFAQGQTEGWYVGGEGGWSHLEDMNFNNGTASGKLSPDEGFAAGVVGGYEFSNGIRAELEAVYRRHDFNNFSGSLTGGPSVSAGVGGDVSNAAVMGNLYYDILKNSPITPYVGAGLGLAAVTMDSVHLGPTQLFDDTEVTLAYQGIVGAKWQINPAWSLNADYRYFGTVGQSFPAQNVAGQPQLSTDYHSHNIMIGFAYHFGPPPAPPPAAAAPVAAPAPAPAPAPAKQQQLFLVFFDFDKATLTPEGAQVVQQAAAAFKTSGVARIMVTGYTDLAGTQKYNLGLSKRRADTVRAALVKQGVPDSAIAEAWRGKENPRVPTPDGVREPQNRRVEIVLP